jgi:hypothetical protein
MTPATFTLGPWRIDEFGRILTADGDILHVRGVSCPMSGYSEAENAEFAANARLIAAAPEMYEALKNIRKELKLSGNWDVKDYGWPDNRAAISAAISKADGVTA